MVFMNEWGISKWFNHFDISHTLLSISAFLFYKGAMKAIDDPFVEKLNKKNLTKKNL
jgi:hypothetical protein